jgi:hypothetical protein
MLMLECVFFGNVFPFLFRGVYKITVENSFFDLLTDGFKQDSGKYVVKTSAYLKVKKENSDKNFLNF